VDDAPGLFAGLKGSVRRAIRKAEKLGLTVEILTDLEAIREFYALQCRTRRKHGLPPQPFRFFLKIHEHILSRDKGVVVLARQGPRTVAGAVFFHFGEQAILKYGASNEAQQGLRGNDLVMWAALKYYASHGCRLLHLGRTSLANAGLRRFKLAWGAREHIIEYVRYDLKLQAFVAGKDDAFGWYNRGFRLLPIGVSRLIGALLYRHAA
jgi:lipid II:glycine glycyltransferase (peptidoglycan interpeptide bridge formation enzyme)